MKTIQKILNILTILFAISGIIFITINGGNNQLNRLLSALMFLCLGTSNIITYIQDKSVKIAKFAGIFIIIVGLIFIKEFVSYYLI